MNFDFPLPDKLSTNLIYSGCHWTKRKAHADMYKMVVKQAVRCYGKVKLDYPVELYFWFEFKGRRLDVSNCSYMIKLIEDGLIHAGVLEGDSPKHVKAIHVWVDKGDEDRVEVEIT